MLKKEEGGNGLTDAAVAMEDRQKAMGTAMGNGQWAMGNGHSGAAALKRNVGQIRAGIGIGKTQ